VRDGCACGVLYVLYVSCTHALARTCNLVTRALHINDLPREHNAFRSTLRQAAGSCLQQLLRYASRAGGLKDELVQRLLRVGNSSGLLRVGNSSG